jgi:hypothetical protein
MMSLTCGWLSSSSRVSPTSRCNWEPGRLRGTTPAAEGSACDTESPPSWAQCQRMLKACLLRLPQSCLRQVYCTTSSCRRSCRRLRSWSFFVSVPGYFSGGFSVVPPGSSAHVLALSLVAYRGHLDWERSAACCTLVDRSAACVSLVDRSAACCNLVYRSAACCTLVYRSAACCTFAQPQQMHTPHITTTAHSCNRDGWSRSPHRREHI